MIRIEDKTDWNAIQFLRLELPTLLGQEQAQQLETKIVVHLDLTDDPATLMRRITLAMQEIHRVKAARERLKELRSQVAGAKAESRYDHEPGGVIPVAPVSDDFFGCPVDPAHLPILYQLYEGQKMECPIHHCALKPYDELVKKAKKKGRER